jgi:uncharacterized membrane protein required for colicin V production
MEYLMKVLENLHWVIDVILLLILLGCAWKGFRNGLIPGIFMLLALFASLYGAKMVAETYSEEFTSVLEPFVSGVTDRAMRTVAEDMEPDAELDVRAVAEAALKEIGIMGTAAETITDRLVLEVSDTGHMLKTAMVKRLCSDAAYVLTLTIVFVLLAVGFAVLGNLINISFHMPGIELVNGILGILFGVGEGLVYAFFITWLSRFGGMLLKPEMVEKTHLLKRLLELNPLDRLFGL